jgi:hypothetical protein
LREKQKAEDDMLFEFLEGKRNEDHRYRTDTLMAKLVLESMYTERNVILQALRYIVKENFFDNE